MPSVVAWWGGKCNDHGVQEELVAYLKALAAESRDRLVRPEPSRPAFLKKLVEVEGESLPKVPPVIEYDGPAEGRILLSPSLSVRPPELCEALTGLGLPRILSGEDGDEAGLFGLERVGLRGVSFRLFDPRGIYALEDRIGFVFLRCPELPILDGSVAQVVGRPALQTYRSEAIRSADWFITFPSIHLRYYLEDWSDQLFSWIKYFFIPDLAYWRYEHLAGYEQASALFEEAGRRETPDNAKRLAFYLLVDWFHREADEWTAKMATW